MSTLKGGKSRPEATVRVTQEGSQTSWAELGQAQLKLGLDHLFSFATLPTTEFFLEIHRKEEK